MTTTIVGLVLPVDGALYPDHLAGLVREGRAATGPRSATLPPAGTGPFRITSVVPRQSVDAGAQRRLLGRRQEGQGRPGHRCCRSPRRTRGWPRCARASVDWIEVPPPDGIPSLKQAGFVISTGSYPHVWPWFYNMAAKNSPFDGRPRAPGAELLHRPRRHRDAAERHGGALGRLAEAQRSGLRQSRATATRSIPPRARSCWPRPATPTRSRSSFKVMISTSGSGQMLPLPMNEALQENLKQACGVDVQVEAVEWQVLLNAARAVPDDAVAERRHGAQCQLAVERRRHDVPLLRRRQLLAQRLQLRAVEGRQVRGGVRRRCPRRPTRRPSRSTSRWRTSGLVDNPPWLFIVHDLNPRAFSKKVKGFVSPQSWFVDLTLVSLQ
mgnify:CR=1 FL=1